jgi:hypothetical protein
LKLRECANRNENDGTDEMHVQYNLNLKPERGFSKHGIHVIYVLPSWEIFSFQKIKLIKIRHYPLFAA